MAAQTLNLNDTVLQEEDNPTKTLDSAQPPSDPAAVKSDRSVDTSNTSAKDPSGTEGDHKEGDESKSTTVASVGSSAGNNEGNSAPVTNIQKKIRRAERFGMPVQLSEEEKRNSRAERFGTGSPVNGSDALKKTEELKRKTRAERFGLPVPPAPSDEETKKKARLARFSAVSKTDTVEEDKRKARAIRFANPPSSSPSEVNGKGNVEHKAAIAGKASGGS